MEQSQLISEVLWHPTDNKLGDNAEDINQENVFPKHIFNIMIISPRVQMS